MTIALDPAGELRTVRTFRACLDTRSDDQPALIASQKGTRMTEKGISDVVQRAAVRRFTYAGRDSTDAVSAHTLRHSVAYRMLSTYDGYTLYNVSKRLRHSHLATTEQRYAHFDTV